MKSAGPRLRALSIGIAALGIASCSSQPGTGIDSLAVGTGYSGGQATGQATQFAAGQLAYVVFTTYSPGKGAVAVVQLIRGGAVEDTSLPISVGQGRRTYGERVSLMTPGAVTVEVSYNGTVQQTTRIKVG